MKATFAFCVYEDAVPVAQALESILVPAARRLPDAQLLACDNSRRPSRALARRLRASGLAHLYHWAGGANLQYAAALNLLVARAEHPYFVYVCLSHCHAFGAGWAEDLLAALERRPLAALAGSLSPGPREWPIEHVQGGLFAARTEILRRFPYSPDYPHDYSDVWQSERLRREGFELLSVPSVLSVHGSWKGEVPERVKLLHVCRKRSPLARWWRRLGHRPPEAEASA